MYFENYIFCEEMLNLTRAYRDCCVNIANTRDQMENYMLCEEVLGIVAIQSQVTSIHVYLRCDRNVILTKLR